MATKSLSVPSAASAAIGVGEIVVVRAAVRRHCREGVTDALPTEFTSSPTC
jgi:hypothetical protein